VALIGQLSDKAVYPCIYKIHQRCSLIGSRGGLMYMGIFGMSLLGAGEYIVGMVI